MAKTYHYKPGETPADIQANLDNALQDVMERAGDEVGNLIGAFFTKVVDGTPVRTGNLVRNWHLNVEAREHVERKVAGRKHRADPESARRAAKQGIGSTKKAIARRVAAFQELNVGITNPVPYLPYVEYGGPHTPAHGMVRKAIAALPTLAKGVRFDYV